MDETARAAIYESAKAFIEIHRSHELRAFNIYWELVADHLDSVQVRPRLFARLTRGLGIGQADWASPIVITMLAAVAGKWPLGTCRPTRPEVQALLETVAVRHGVPVNFGITVTPFALQMYSLPVGDRPRARVDDYFEVSSNVPEAPEEMARSRATALITGESGTHPYHLIIRIYPEGWSDGRAYNATFEGLTQTETTFLVTLLEARRRLRITELTTHVYGQPMSAPRVRDRIKKVRTRVVEKLGDAFRQVIRAEDNGELWSIDPDVQFCILRHAFRQIEDQRR